MHLLFPEDEGKEQCIAYDLDGKFVKRSENLIQDSRALITSDNKRSQNHLERLAFCHFFFPNIIVMGLIMHNHKPR